MWRTLQRAVSFVLGFGIMLALAQVVPARTASPVPQPLEFDHKKHIAADWACGACHPHTDREPFAGVPNVPECVDCHESEAPKHPENKRMAEMTGRLRAMLAKGERIPWAQVHRTAPHVYFSHQRHVESGGLKCETCHGDVGQLTRSVSRPAFPAGQREKMAWCIACHEKKRVTTDCAACHR